MQTPLSARYETRAFSWLRVALSAACALAWISLPLLAQDDTGGGGPPPPPDNGAQPPDYSAGDAQDDSGSSASFQTFYDALGSQGTWIQSSDYGYVWQPQVSDPDWAPYTDGSWAYTDDGWAWVSDEPWGWATYHYGRWVNLDGSGWCWVPGYTWAPAWVSWRYGDGYCGWAPLPPDSFAGIDYFGGGFALGFGFHIGGDCDGLYGIGAGCYNFLPLNCLGYRNYHHYYYNRGNNYAIINHTTNVTNINVTKGRFSTGAAADGSGGFHHVTTEGPSLSQVNAVSQTPIQRVSLLSADQPDGGGMLNGNSLSLYRPRVSPGTTGQPARVGGSIGQATINRGTDITHPLAVNSHLSPSPATEAQVQQARIAQDHAPASAKVVTYNDQIKPIPQGPLTSMKPMALVPSRSSGSSSQTERSASQPERGNAGPVISPAERTYPQTGDDRSSSRVYYPQTSPPSIYHSGPSSTSARSTPGSGVRPASNPYSHSSSPASSGSRSGTGGAPSGGGSAAHSSSGSGGGNRPPQGH